MIDFVIIIKLAGIASIINVYSSQVQRTFWERNSHNNRLMECFLFLKENRHWTWIYLLFFHDNIRTTTRKACSIVLTWLGMILKGTKNFPATGKINFCQTSNIFSIARAFPLDDNKFVWLDARPDDKNLTRTSNWVFKLYLKW